jgi:voltage-gated potassium channel
MSEVTKKVLFLFSGFCLILSSGSSGAEIKLKRAGADKVISPYYIGGRRMAQFMLRPNVTDFIDLAMYTYDMSLRLEEILVTDKAPISGLSLMQSNLRQQYNIIVIGIKRRGGKMQFNPKPDTVILSEDILIVLGQHKQISALEKEMQG